MSFAQCVISNHFHFFFKVLPICGGRVVSKLNHFCSVWVGTFCIGKCQDCISDSRYGSTSSSRCCPSSPNFSTTSISYSNKFSTSSPNLSTTTISSSNKFSTTSPNLSTTSSSHILFYSYQEPPLESHPGRENFEKDDHQGRQRAPQVSRDPCERRMRFHGKE